MHVCDFVGADATCQQRFSSRFEGNVRRNAEREIVRKVLVVCALDDEGLGGQIVAPWQKLAGQLPPSELVGLCVGDLVVSALVDDAFVEFEEVDMSVADFGFAI